MGYILLLALVIGSIRGVFSPWRAARVPIILVFQTRITFWFHWVIDVSKAELIILGFLFFVSL